MGAFKVGHKKVGGRKPGSLNKKTIELQEVLSKGNFNPAEKLIYIYQTAIKEYERADEISDAIMQDKFERGIPADKINNAPTYLKIASDAAKDLMQYVYPKRKAVEVSGPDGAPLTPSVSVDLSALSDGELEVLKKVVVDGKDKPSDNS